MSKFANANHDAINPNLIAALTHKPISSIPPKPSVAMLPGKWASRLHGLPGKPPKYKSLDKPNRHMLVCRSCGHQDHYDLGSILLDPDRWEKGRSAIDETDETAAHELFLQCMNFTRYIRCTQCNRADGWDLDPRKMEREFATYLKDHPPSARKPGESAAMYGWGQLQTSDGTMLRSTMDMEEYYLSRLADQAQSAKLWFQLGSVYANGGRGELAAAAFERALALNPGHTETHVSMGFVLLETKWMKEAADHFHLALISAHEYESVPPLELRNLLVTAIYALSYIHNESGRRIPLLPLEEEYRGYFNDESAFRRYYDRFGDSDHVLISSSDPDTFSRLAEFFMWRQADRIPVEERKAKPGESVFFNPAETGQAQARPLPSGLGSARRPILLGAVSEDQIFPVTRLCDMFGWEFIVEVGRGEDLSDLAKALKEAHSPKNLYDPCPCGSGEKYKFCCMRKFREMSERELVFHYYRQYVVEPASADRQ